MKISAIKEELESALVINDLWFQWLMMEKMQCMMLLQSPLRDSIADAPEDYITEYLTRVEQQIVDCVAVRHQMLMQLSELSIRFPEN